MLTMILRFARGFVSTVLVTVFLIPQNAVPQTSQHVVSPSDLAKATIDATQARRKNLDTLNRFFSSDNARTALHEAKIDPQQVKKAVAALSDEELAQLATRVQKAQSDFAAGYIGTRDLILILIAIAVLILIIVAVH